MCPGVALGHAGAAFTAWLWLFLTLAPRELLWFLSSAHGVHTKARLDPFGAAGARVGKVGFGFLGLSFC